MAPGGGRHPHFRSLALAARCLVVSVVTFGRVGDRSPVDVAVVLMR